MAGRARGERIGVETSTRHPELPTTLPSHRLAGPAWKIGGTLGFGASYRLRLASLVPVTAFERVYLRG